MWHRLAVVALLASAGCAPALAQSYSPWNDGPFWERPSRRYTPPFEQPDWDAPQARRPAQVRDGGARPDIAPQAPPIVAFAPDYPAGSIVIDSGGRKLYFVLPNKQAFQYAISVGREGFAWAGTEQISRKQPWPDWHPPAEMRQRDPKLPVKMTGGLKNPLGAIALYLGNTLYRIHGTNDEKTIGQAASSGCFRMMNSAVLHLSQMAQVGTSVTVVNSLPGAPAAVAAHKEPPPPVPPAAQRAPQVQPPAAMQDEDRDDYERAEDVRRGRDDDEEDDVADVTVQDTGDYDPYARRTYGSGRYPSRRERGALYPGESGGRVWYDDERDDQ